MIDHSKKVIYGIKWTLPYGTSEKYNLYYQLSPYSNQKKEGIRLLIYAEILQNAFICHLNSRELLATSYSNPS